MTTFYDSIEKSSKGAWVVHHSQKTAATVNGAAEFPALDAAGKAASLLSQLAATAQSTLDSSRVQALARAAGLSPRIEPPELLRVLEQRRLIEKSAEGDIEVLGLTSGPPSSMRPISSRNSIQHRRSAHPSLSPR